MMWLSLAFTVGSAGFNATMHMVTKREGASLAFFAYLLTVASFVSFVGTRLVTPLSFSALSPVFFAWTAGTMLGEMLYALGLRFAYRTLDLSVVYPMTRALPILFLAVVTTAFGFGKPISPRGALGLLMVCGGSLMVPLRSFSELRLPDRIDRRFGFVLLAAVGITIRTLCDSQGLAELIDTATESGISLPRPIFALAFCAFRSTPITVCFWLAALSTRNVRRETFSLLRRCFGASLLAAICDTATTLLLFAAMAFATNVSFVQAFRQIGLLFGLAEAVFILKEPCTAPKVAGTVTILAGVLLSVL